MNSHRFGTARSSDAAAVAVPLASAARVDGRPGTGASCFHKRGADGARQPLSP